MHTLNLVLMKMSLDVVIILSVSVINAKTKMVKKLNILLDPIDSVVPQKVLDISPEDREVYTESQTTAHRPTLPQLQSWWRR